MWPSAHTIRRIAVRLLIGKMAAPMGVVLTNFRPAIKQMRVACWFCHGHSECVGKAVLCNTYLKPNNVWKKLV